MHNYKALICSRYFDFGKGRFYPMDRTKRDAYVFDNEYNLYKPKTTHEGPSENGQ